MVLRTLALFLVLGSSLHAQDLNMQLIDAAMRGDVAQIKSLLGSGAKPNTPDDDKRTPIAYAAAHGSLGAVQVLIDAGAAPDARDQEGGSPLMMAAAEGHTSIVALLVEKISSALGTGEPR